MRVVAVTGASTYLGGELLRRLDEDRRIGRVLALDIRPPALAPNSKLEYVHVDLTQPTVDGELATLLRTHRVDTLVHGAFLSHPTHEVDRAHELEDVGTMHVLNACAAVEPRRLVVVSTTLAYGAHPRNPNYLVEDHELRGNRVALCDHQDYLNRLIPQSETPALKRGEVRRNYSLGREDGIDPPR